MKTFLKQIERKNELLQKRWVFDNNTPSAPRESAPVAPQTSREQLSQRSAPELQANLEAARADLRAKMEQAKQLIPQLEGKNEQQQSALAEQIKALLDQIEANTQLRAEFSSDVYLVKIEVAKRLKGIFDKITWSMPSIEGVQTAFEGGSTWQNILKSGPLLMAHFKNLMYVFFGSGKAEAIKSAAAQTPQTNPNTPGNTPSQTPPATPERPRENLDQNILRLGDFTAMPPDANAPDFLKFSVRAANQTIVYRVKANGEGLQVQEGNEFKAHASTGLELVNYLKNHISPLSGLKTKIGEGLTGEAATEFETRLAMSLIKLQATENAKQPPRIDVANVLNEKWEAFKQHPEIGRLGSMNNIRNMFINAANESGTAESILRILKSVSTPSQPAGSFPPSTGTGSRTS